MFFGTPSRESVLGSSIRQSRILAEGSPACGKRQIPEYINKNNHCNFAFGVLGTPSRESVLGSSIRRSRILAEGLPLAGNGKFPHITTKTIIAILHSVFFDTPSRESVLGSSIRQSRIDEPRVSRLRETLNLFPWSSVFSYAKRSLYSRAGVLRLVPTPFSF